MSDNNLICPFCGRNDFKRKEGLTRHIHTCKKNPNRVDGPNKGKKLSDETKQKLSEAAKIVMNRPEVKQKRSETSKLMWEDPEVRRKISEAQKKRYEDPEEHRKISEATKKGMEDPDVRQKMSEAAKKRCEDPEVRQKMSEAAKKRCEDPEEHRKISEAQKKRYEDPEERRKTGETSKLMWEDPEVRQKSYLTKKKNNSFNTSKIECELKNYFDSNNIEYITQYKSDLYPFMCDFYFPDKDLYVEIQGTWTHGGKPYNSEDNECIEQLEKWKAKNTKFYDSAINTWTIRDVKKRHIAKQNNLNWIEIFSNDLNECLKQLELVGVHIATYIYL